MFWKKKSPHVAAEERCAHALYEKLAEGLREKDSGRIRAEDIIAAAASIVAELCIVAAGDFNPRKHEMTPGMRVFSTKVNELFAGDKQGIETVPSESIVGIVRDKLLVAGYDKGDFPPLTPLFQRFAANVGKHDVWGKVAWSVPEANYPRILPLRVAYATRSTVDSVFAPLTDPSKKLLAATLTLVEVLVAVRQVIDKKIALLLALETINGMAKTAPMTDEAMAAASKNSGQQ